MTASTNVTITALPTPTIEYPDSPYCSSTPSATVILTGPGGGVYTGSSGVFVNASTGTVSIGLSLPGTHTITYTTPTIGGCASVSVSTQLVITALPYADYSYPGTPFCPNESGILPQFFGDSGGTFSSGAGLSIDPASGIIDPSQSDIGAYTILYTFSAQGGCPEVVFDADIVIQDITRPVIQTPPNIVILCYEDLDPMMSGTATATDDCTPAPIITYTDQLTPGNCLNRGTVVRTWTATDEIGNSTSKTQTIIINVKRISKFILSSLIIYYIFLYCISIIQCCKYIIKVFYFENQINKKKSTLIEG